MEPVSVFWLESMFGVSLDTDPSLSSLINRHLRYGGAKAKVFFVQNGVKRFVQFVN